MASHNNALWQTVTFLFLSKFIRQANVEFGQKQLINAKNVELAQKFAEMVGDATENSKIKLALLKGLKQVEKGGWLQRIDENTLSMNDAGFEKMQTELQTAMMKIARDFPDSAPQKQPAPTMQ
ncbi:MAG: hypothetical protein B6I36_08370 [Desulfobacteraceae bacterium 4572_35.1]|nr:MAG: hypothetical protein B6I36_08370 [Desulfobacteraceae bacterium 4572_35.1]